MAPPVVEFYCDIACPYNYIASCRIDSIVLQNKAQLLWKPVLLGGVYDLVKAPQGKAGSASDVDPIQKKVLASQDLGRNVARFGIPFSWHPNHPVKSLFAMRLLAMIPESSRGRLTKRLFRAYWVDNINVADKDQLLKIAKEEGFVFQLDVFEDQAGKDLLRKNTQEAVDRGAPGVPFFFVNGDHFWGQDRLHFVDRALGNPNAKQFRAIGNPQARSKPRLLTFYYDFSSPWSYIGSTQVERIVKEAGPNVTLELVPILLGALFKEIGTPNVPMMAMSEAKRTYYGKDMQDWLQWWGGVPFNFPSQFPIRSVVPLRVAIVEPKTFHVIYKAAWVDDVNIGQEEELVKVLDSAGFNGKALIKASEAASVKETLKVNTSRAANAGVCGVPSFQVNGGDVIWGQDRFDVVLDLLDGWTKNEAKPSHL